MDRNETKVPYSDEWWFERLWRAMYERKRRRDSALHDRVSWMDVLWSWYEGDPPTPEHTSGWQRDITQQVLRMGRANYAKLAVDSKLDRCKVRSFRTAAVDDDPDGDEESPDSPEALARKMMKRARVAFNEALLHASVMLEGYIAIGGNDPRTQLPAVTAEDPRSCIGLTDPLDDTLVVAFMKFYRDTIEKRDYVHLTLPDDPKKPLGKYNIRVYWAPMSSGTANRLDFKRWTLDEDRSGSHPIPNRGSCVHPVSAPQGQGDFEPFLDLLERINSGIVDRLWTSKIQVFRQRAIEWDPKVLSEYAAANPGGDDEESGTGGYDPLPTHDEDGEPIDYTEVFSADPGALWKLPVGAKIWESTPTDLQAALLAVRDDVKEFAGVSRTPLYSLMPDVLQGSAAGAQTARETHMFKVIGFRQHVEAVLLNACADMLAGAGVPVEKITDLELQWGPSELKSDTERTAGAVAARTAGVPWQGTMEDYLEADPETVVRYKRFRNQDRLFPEFKPPAIVPPPAEPEPTPPVTDRGADAAAAS